MATKNPYRVQPAKTLDYDALMSNLNALPGQSDPEEKPSVARRIGDTAVQFGQGAVTGVKMMSDIFGANNAVSSGLSDVNQALDGLLSATAQGDKQKVAQIMQEAEGKGWGEQIVAGLKAAGVDPVGLAANALGTSLPTMATMLIPGAGPAAVAARMGAGVAMGAGQGVGAVKGQIYDETKRKWLEARATPEQAEAKAQEAAAYGGENTDQMAIGGVLGMGSVLGAERALGKVLHGASKAGPGMLGRVATSTLAETGTEMLQGGQEKFATNTALNRQGFDVDPMSGVIANATLEGAAAAHIGAVAGIPKPAVATAPGIDPAQEAADTIRATEKVPESGALTKAVNAGVEAKAKAVEAGGLQLAPLVVEQTATATNGLALEPLPGESAPEPVDDPVRDQILALPDGARQDALRAYAVVNRTDVAKGVQQYNRKLLDRLLEENKPEPEATPEIGDVVRTFDPTSQPVSELSLVPMGEMAYDNGIDFQPDSRAELASRSAELDRLTQRAPRTRTDGVGLNLQADPVLNYLDNLRGVNTPAARAYVRDFDAGRITPADVQQRMQAERGLTPEQRIARAAAEAPAQTDPVADRLARAAAQGMTTPAPTDILNPSGEPFKTKMAADRAAKKSPGAAVLPVADGGFLVRPQEPVNVQDVPQAPEVPQAAPAVSQPGQAPQAVGEQPAGPAAGVPAEGAGAGVRADGVGKEQFDPEGLKPGTPEYEAAFEKWISDQSDKKLEINRARQRQENTAAVQKRNGWRSKIREWFLGAKDGDTITDTGTGQSYKVIERTRKDGTKIKTLAAVDENGAPLGDGRAATGIAQVGNRVEGLDDGGIDDDTGSATPETAGQSLASSLGKLLEDGDAKTATPGATDVQADGVKEPPFAKKEDVEHLFGIDQKRKAALDRIAKGAAYFSTKEKAADFVAKSGIKDTHEVVQTGKVRFEVMPKVEGARQTKNDIITERRATYEGKPATLEIIRKKDDPTNIDGARIKVDGERLPALNLGAQGPQTDDKFINGLIETEIINGNNQRADGQPAEPFEHAGLKIRPSRVKEGEQVVDRWVVQSPENAEREARGERQIGGDRIVETREQAIKTAEQQSAPAPQPGPVRLGRDQTPLAEGGKPFKTRKAAGDAKKLQPMMRVVTVPGGYALAEKTPAQLAAEERASRRLRNPNTSARGEPIPAHAFIAAAGGLNRAAASDMGVDGNPRIGNRTLFAGKGRGLSMDQATQMLIQDGYLSEGATINDALALIKKSLTQPQYNADGIERIAQAEADAQFEDYLAAQEDAAVENDEFDPFGPASTVLDGFSDDMLETSGYDAATDAIKAEVRALLEMANAQGIDAESIMLEAHEQTRNATEQDYYEAAKSALEAAIAGSNRDRGTPAGSEGQGPGAAAASTAEQGVNQPESLDQQAQTATENAAPAALELAAQTPAEAAARQEQAEQAEKSQAAAKRAADAAAKAEDERKRIAQASVRAADRFELGQDPMDSLTGQGGLMFSRTGAKSPNAQQPTTRAWYDRFVSLLPASYRNDPHRREPFPAEDWNVQRASEVRSKVEALNKQLRGADDRKGYGPVSVDGLGNLQVDARDVSVADLTGGIMALANELGAGIAATNVRSADARALQNSGFVSESSLAAIADRLMQRPFASPTNNYAKDSAPGAVMTYKPRGFPAALFARDVVQNNATPARPTDSNARNAATQLLIDGLKAKWTRAPEIIVARNMQDTQIPQEVRDYDALLKSQGATGEPRGFIYKGKVYLLTDQLKGPQQIAEVLFHEVLGHYGLRGAFGDGLTPILKQLGALRRKEVVAKAREYGLFNKNALGGLDKAAASDSQIWAAMSNKQRLDAAEEVLAEMAQTQPTIGFVQRAIAAIRNWLRANVPGFKNLKLTDADIVQAYILPARGYVTRSQETGAQSLERAMRDAGFSRTAGDQTQTEAFKRWFKDSKVVDADGRPGRDTNAGMATNEVVGKNQGGRSADDISPGASFDAQAAFEKHGGTGDIDESTDITAKSQAFADMAEAEGYTVIGRGDKYVTIKKSFGQDADGYAKTAIIKVRISDHSNVNRGNHFGETDINIAPDDGYSRDTFADALRKIQSAYVNDDLDTVIPSEPTASGLSDAANPDIRFSRTTAQSIASSMGDMTPDQEKAYKNVAGVKAVPTVRERMDALKANLGLKLRQGLVDQFAAIKQLDQNAYVQARMSKGTDGTLEAMLMYGKPFMRDGAPDVDVKDGGFAKVLASLKGEQDRWMMWIAAQRAEKLKAEGKENLMTDDDISALKTLNAGKMADGTARMPIYAKALQELNDYNDAMLKLAMDSGLIDKDAYDLMAGQPYVPFYRIMEDGDMKGPKFSSGLTNQKAWQKLKGGTQQLNADLLQNMLLNWSHLLQASAKNRAATATMDAAEKMAVAYKVDADTKGSVKVMRDGSAEHWMVEDPYLLDAISAIHYVPSPLMKPLAKFKQLLTWGVTVNPTFKIRNLIRDSVSAIAQADLGYNPGANVAKGWKLTAKDSQIYASMLASGGLIKFGTQENTDRLRAQVAKLGGVVLDKSGAERFFGQIKDLYDVYNEFGDRAENVNRAALYDALIKKGKTHAEAAFMARDLMDFSMGGSAPVVRFLTQTVPFLNARLVGLDKLGRAAMEDPRRFAAVTGAVALASLALMAGYSDDEDWKKREDWDRDAYWWFKVGEQAYRIPKPFEVGAIGTLAERTAELMLSDEMTGKRYMERVSHMLSGTFSFNPVPQAFKPLLDLYANKDSFTGRAIESQADQRLRPQDRYSERTPEVAKFLGGLGLPDPAQLVKGEYSALSPKQVEHLIRGYFSWVGTAAMTVSDFGLRPLAGRGERPDMRLKDVFIAGNFVENLPTGSSRYVTQMYEQARQAEQAYASYQEAIKAGDTDKAQSIKESAGPLLRNRPAYTAATRQLAEINRMAKRIEADQAMAGAAKRARLTQLEQQRHVIAQRVSRLAAATP